MARTWRPSRLSPTAASLAVAFAVAFPPIAPVQAATSPAPSIHASSFARPNEVTRRAADGSTQIAVDVVVRSGTSSVVTTEAAVADRAIRRLGGSLIAGDTGPVGRTARAASPDVLEAWVPVGAVAVIGRTSGVLRVDPVRPLVVTRGATATRGSAATQASGSPTGIDVGAGAALLGAVDWHSAGYTGRGIRVGIIDGGFSGLADRVATEFPGGVQARCYTEVGVSSSMLAACSESDIEHGTAVAETIASVAPDATIFVANPISYLDVQESIAWMVGRGVRVINASFGAADIFEGPGDGSSPYSDSYYRAIDAAVRGGALWVNAAGNSGDLGWSGSWSDANANRWLDFAPGVESDPITLAADTKLSLALRWSDPWGSSADDYDLYLYPEGSSVPVASSTTAQRGSGFPVERLTYRSPIDATYDVRVLHRAGGTASHLQLLGQVQGVGGPLTYSTSDGTLTAPADSANPGMVSVGAVDVRTPDAVEEYSSRGPTTDGRFRPDVVAPDCADTQQIAGFCGTSQAAPYTTGAAALLLQANPTLAPAGLAEALRSHAVPLSGGTVPNDVSGWGRVSLGAAPIVAPPGPPAIPTAPPVGVVGISMPEAAYAWRAMATGSGGLVHLVFGDTSGAADTILYRRSSDGGSTFGDAMQLSSPDEAAAYGSVAAAGQTVAAAWLEGDLGGSGAVAVRVRTSPDGGASWSPPVSVSPAGQRAGNPAIATDGVHVVVAWTNAVTGRVAVAVSGDGGTTFGAPRVVGSTTLAPFSGFSDRDGLPAVSLVGSVVHLAWSSSGSVVMYRRSADLGASWGSARLIDGIAAGSSRVWLVASGSAVVLAYAARPYAGGRSLVYLRRSGDGGVTWASRRLVASVTSLASTNPVAITSGAVIRIAWAQCTTTSCTRARLWYRQSATGGVTWSSSSILTGASTYVRPVGLVTTRRILLLYTLTSSGADETGEVFLRAR